MKIQKKKFKNFHKVTYTSACLRQIFNHLTRYTSLFIHSRTCSPPPNTSNSNPYNFAVIYVYFFKCFFTRENNTQTSKDKKRRLNNQPKEKTRWVFASNNYAADLLKNFMLVTFKDNYQRKKIEIWLNATSAGVKI